MTRAPLDGLRVLSVSQFDAGPFGTQVLADLGAEIIKIEDPLVGGDVARYVPPYQEGRDSLYFQSFNRGKKSLTLDLRHPEAIGVLHDLVRVSHGVYNNLRGDLPEKLGLTYSTLGAVIVSPLDGSTTRRQEATMTRLFLRALLVPLLLAVSIAKPADAWIRSPATTFAPLRGLLFPASLVRSGNFIYVTNLALDLRRFGLPQPVDAQWAAQVTTHTISRINAHLAPIHGLPRP